MMMLSRALSLATVTLLIGCFAAAPVQAQAQNLEAGKSPSQIFAGTCTACHKSPRGLLKSVAAGSLQGFLRQHYTTSPEMASLLSAYLISNGAADTRVGAQPRPAKDAKSDGRPSGPAAQLDRYGRPLRPGGPPQQAAQPEAEPRDSAKPDADGLSTQAEPGRKGHSGKRMARPGPAPDGTKPAAEGQEVPAQTASERGPDGRKLTARQKLTKRGKPGGEEPPKTDSAKSDATKEEPPKGEAATDDKPKSETAKDEGNKPEGSTPSGEAKSESGKPESVKSEPAKPESAKSESSKSESAKSEQAKPESTKPESAKPESARPDSARPDSARIDSPKETGSGSPPVLRADPVPAVTPASPASPAVSAAVSGAAPEPVAAPSAPAAQPAPPAVTASEPPAPVIPAGTPVPPISK
jgi:hypothetical protein